MRNEEDVSQLLDAYARHAASHGEATESGDFRRANAAATELERLYSELAHQGRLLELRNLFDSESPGVRLWAASHVLEVEPDEAIEILKAVASIPASLVAFSAQVTLQEWRDGTLEFGNRD